MEDEERQLASQKLLTVLHSSADAKGRELEVHKIDFPAAKDSSYTDFLVLNKGVIVPAFGDDKEDLKALKIINGVFPSRRVCQLHVSSPFSLRDAALALPYPRKDAVPDIDTLLYKVPRKYALPGSAVSRYLKRLARRKQAAEDSNEATRNHTLRSVKDTISFPQEKTLQLPEEEEAKSADGDSDAASVDSEPLPPPDYDPPDDENDGNYDSDESSDGEPLAPPSEPPPQLM